MDKKLREISASLPFQAQGKCNRKYTTLILRDEALTLVRRGKVEIVR